MPFHRIVVMMAKTHTQTSYLKWIPAENDDTLTRFIVISYAVNKLSPHEIECAFIGPNAMECEDDFTSSIAYIYEKDTGHGHRYRLRWIK